MALSEQWCFLLLTLSFMCLIDSQDHPTYAADDIPQTRFSCRNKVNGGYYADIETGCQMYHVCSRDKHGNMESTKFLCGNGTVFDQRHLVCQDYRKVQRCRESRKYYRTRGRFLEHLEDRLRNEKSNKEILDEENPTYRWDGLPRTGFSCTNKVNGGFFADIETGCQMYHVCSRDKDGTMRSTQFLCGKGTIFDQRQLVCQDYRKAENCQESIKYYQNQDIPLEHLEDPIPEEVYPSYRQEDYPQTTFSCKNKRNGGYYADIEVGCQMYHVCSRDKNGTMKSTKFLCGEGTVFDQRHLVCEDYSKVPDCQESREYYQTRTALLEHLEGRLRNAKINEGIIYDANFEAGPID